MNKEEESYPNVITKAMVLSCIMDDLEVRDVDMVDIPRGFLQADMDDIVNMRIYGAMVELLTRVDTGQYE